MKLVDVAIKLKEAHVLDIEVIIMVFPLFLQDVPLDKIPFDLNF